LNLLAQLPLDLGGGRLGLGLEFGNRQLECLQLLFSRFGEGLALALRMAGLL
jgi:hypothetical protein